jgi:hypothetical protein
LQVGALFERVHGGAVGHAEGSCRGEVHRLGNWQDVVARDGDLLGEAAPAGQSHDPVAYFKMADLLAHRRDHAGRFAAWRKREGWFELVFALDDQGVGEVDPGRVHVQQDFILLGFRRRNVFQHQVFGGAEGFAEHGFHRGLFLFL